MKVITKFDCSNFWIGRKECQTPHKSVNMAKQLYYIDSAKYYFAAELRAIVKIIRTCIHIRVQYLK